jgi:DNA-binding NarL/FixJ family response regulator
VDTVPGPPPDATLAGALERARAAHRLRRFDVVRVELAPLVDDPRVPTGDLALLADAAWWLGQVRDMLAVTEVVHQRYLAEGAIERAAYHALDLAGVLLMSGRHAQGMGWMSRAGRLLEGLPPGPGHGIVTYIEATEALASQRLDDARRHAAALDELGRALGDDTFVALSLLVHGLAEIRAGRLEAGFRRLDEAMLPVVADRVRPELAGNIYCTILSTCIELADLPRAREWADATERWVEGFSHAAMFAGVCRSHRVELLVAEGAWREAEREARQVVVELADLNASAVALAEYLLGETRRVRGDTAQARRHYARAAELGREPQPGSALVTLAEGRGAAAWDEICSAVGEDIEPFACARLLRAQVTIGLATGHPETAGAAALRLGELRETYRTPAFGAWADEAEGAVLLASGRPADAVALLRRAGSGYRRLAMGYDRAVVELRLAQAHRALGDRLASRSCDDTGRALLRRLDAVPPPGLGPSGDVLPGRLTMRELEVLRQVATGVSNRDAASALRISEATLRRHLANIYAKLDVGSRTAAAAWAHDHGVTG